MAKLTLELDLPDETMKKKLMETGVAKANLEDPGLEVLDMLTDYITKEGAAGIDVHLEYDNFCDDPIKEADEDNKD